jgi:ATP phosphoribosyltransferase regulatory subunit
MTFSEDVLKNEEKAIMSLRSLYRQYGYTQYKMSKFEEYDLYVRNKNFLVSDNIITFNDLNGKLMALKPDVTLSIVKNTKDADVSLQKFCYNENVYRLSSTSHEFKERMQVGLECIGNIDVYSMSEVIMLADESLGTISERHRLDLSHMKFLSGLLDSMELTDGQQAQVLRCISEKNAPELNKLCDAYRFRNEFREKLNLLTTLYGPFERSVGALKEISVNEKTDDAVKELECVYKTVKTLGAAENIFLDFSIVNDMNYYNGIIFQGFIDGIPTGILSGGRYDNLMQRFGKKSGAIGFAVYLDLLERLNTTKRAFDVDVMLCYDDETDAADLAAAVKTITSHGESVRAQKGESEPVKYRRLVRIKDGRLEELEHND